MYKQKKADEMRNSDWSSDVCSSDLFLCSLGNYDPSVIDDGTYFVLEHEGRVVGSGGWSQRLPHAELPEETAGGGDTKLQQPFSLSPHPANIRSILVPPGSARLGLGSRPLRSAEAEAAAAGHCRPDLRDSTPGLKP